MTKITFFNQLSLGNSSKIAKTDYIDTLDFYHKLKVFVDEMHYVIWYIQCMSSS